MKPVFCAASMLLPGEDTNMKLWCALACDQFTSQPEYWDRAEQLVCAAPSTLHITLPEVYLKQEDKAELDARIAEIHNTMADYELNVLSRRVEGFVYVERTTQSGTRCGLVGAVDLESYSYEKGALPLVRPSENTVVERIPPRLAVRRGAELETPHILMLADDAEKTVVEPIGAKKAALPKLYDTDLVLDGGHVTGWAVTDAADIAAIEQAVCALARQEKFDAKYPAQAGAKPLALAVGDGNHSLATAKAYWEELKAKLSPEEQERHPARYALVEVENIHSEAICIEPIHRAVFGTELAAFSAAFRAWLAAHGAKNCSIADARQQFNIVPPCQPDGAADFVECIQNAPHVLAVGTLEMFLADFCAEHPGTTVDYIHGEAAVRALAQKGAVGILLPEFAKSDLFRGVVAGGVLPKKTFSMGEATEKRYYLECRRIAL